MARKRILLAGAGRWGKIYLRNLEKNPRAFAAGLVTSQQRHSLPHLEPSTELFPTLEAGLRAEKWDGVILATPPETHASQLRLCLKEGLAVIVEKPLTLSLAEAEGLQAIPASANVLVDHIFLFHPGYEKMKDLVAEYGGALRVHSEGGNTGPYRTYSPLWDYGAHDLSMILDLLGELPERVSAEVRGRGEKEGGLTGDYSVKLAFRSGVEATFGANNLSIAKLRRISVETARYRLVLEDYPAAKLTRIDSRNGLSEEIPLPAVSPLASLLEVFCDGIDGKRDARWGLRLGTDVVRTLAACERTLVQA